MPYFAPRVPDPAYRPAAGTVPTVDTSVVVPAGSGPGGVRVRVAAARPIPLGAATPVYGSVALPGSAPTMIGDLVAAPLSSQVSSGFSSAPAVDLNRVVVEPCAFRPVSPRVVAVSSDVVAAELESRHYPRAPIKRHKRKRRAP